MCRSADLRLVRIVKRWLRRRTRSIPSEETPTPPHSTASGTRNHCLHRRDDDCSTSGLMSPINGGIDIEDGGSTHRHRVGDGDAKSPSSMTTEYWRCRHECCGSWCPSLSVPLSSTMRRRRAMFDDGVTSARSTSSLSADFPSQQSDSLLSVDMASDQSTSWSTTSSRSSSSSSSSSSTVVCCFCRRWRRSRLRQTGGKRRTESDDDDDCRGLTASGVRIEPLSEESSCLVACRPLAEATSRSHSRSSPRRQDARSADCSSRMQPSSRHRCPRNNNIDDNLVCSCAAATKCNASDPTSTSSTVNISVRPSTPRRSSRFDNRGQQVRVQYPPSIAISADGEEPTLRPLVSVMRPDRRDCNGPPPNRVAPFS